MHRLFGVAALTLAVAVIPSVGVASANGGNRHLVKKFDVWAETVQDNFLDLGDEGTTLGDRFVFSDDLSRTRGGRVIGTDGGECTVVRIDEEFYEATVQCLVTVSLSGGDITIQGLVAESEERATLAVTGGTGRYEGAGGRVRVLFVTDTVSRFSFRLIL
jgi:hypothetical protein